MASRNIRIDRSSRQLLRGNVSFANYRLPVVGPYVMSVDGILRAKRDCVRQRGGWVSRWWADGERDRDPGSPDGTP